MRNRIMKFGIAILTVLMISYGCEKETTDFMVPDNIGNQLPKENSDSSADDSGQSLPGLGMRLPDFSGGARSQAVSFSIGSKIFLGFGFNHAGPLYDFWEWDYARVVTEWDVHYDKWIRLPDFPGFFPADGISVGSPAGFSVNGKGYILAGAFWHNGNVVQELWEFDPEVNEWTRKADPPVPLARFYMAGFSIGTKLYIGTGEIYVDGKKIMYQDIWEWDQTTDTWSRKANFPGEARAHATGFSIGNKGYIGLGGEVGIGGGPVYQDFWEYDQTTDQWTQKASFVGLQRIDAVGFSIGSMGYITAGWNSLVDNSKERHEIWQWDQSNDTWTRIGIFSGNYRTGAVGGSIGKLGYLLTGQKLSDDWENNFLLNDFWFLDLTGN